MESIEDVMESKKFGGFVVVELSRQGEHGPEVTQRRVSHNTVVNTGKRQTWRQACNLNTNAWDQFRIGTSGAAVTSAQTNVLSRITATLVTASPGPTLLSGTRTLQLVVSYPSGGGSKSVTGIEEVVVLNQNTSPGGSALMRAVFTAVNKTTADKLKITYNVRIT